MRREEPVCQLTVFAAYGYLCHTHCYIHTPIIPKIIQTRHLEHIMITKKQSEAKYELFSSIVHQSRPFACHFDLDNRHKNVQRNILTEQVHGEFAAIRAVN